MGKCWPNFVPTPWHYGRPLCFSDWPKKYQLGRGLWDLASCQVLLNSGQWFQRRSWKCLSQSEARAAILFLRSAQNTNLVEDVEVLLPVKFCWIPFSGFREGVENVSAKEARAAILFIQSARKTKIWWRTLRSCFLSSFVEFRLVVSEEKSKMSQPIRGQGRHLVFRSARKTLTW